MSQWSQGQGEGPLCPLLTNVPTWFKGTGYKHLMFAEAGIQASTPGFSLGKRVHWKEAIVPTGRGGRTEKSSCSASAKFYYSLDEGKIKRFIFALKGAKFNFSKAAEYC